ncbi:hypothetical protein C8Q78DRAFT_1050114 [Trametes maxima]|nr:hypothetical protein C8Q78DRAFT_1050114 [Trametes maxima]
MAPAALTAPPSPQIPAVPALDNLYGAYLLGTFISLILYGVVLVQLYRYIRLHSADTMFMKSLVATVMILETTHIILLIHSCYFYLISNFNDPFKLTHSVWSLELTSVVSSLITVVSQIFFARRVSLIGFRYMILVVFASLALLAHVGFAIGITVNAFKVNSLSGFEHGGDWLFPSTLGSATIADALLSAGILHAVRRSRGSQQSSKDESTFDLVILYVVNSGVLTGVVNAIPTIVAFKLPQTFIWAGLSFVGTRFYAITLLAVLNTRKLHISRGMEIFHTSSNARNIIARANHLAAIERWNAPQVPEDEPAKIDISISNEVEVQKDTFNLRSLDKYEKYNGRSA